MIKNRDVYVEIFKALSDETRLEILDHLMQRQLCACQLQAVLDNSITQSSVSYHMKILMDAGLVLSAREGKWIRYSVDVDQFKHLQTFLSALSSKNNSLESEDFTTCKF